MRHLVTPAESSQRGEPNTTPGHPQPFTPRATMPMFRLTAPFYAAVISEAVLTRHMLRLSAQTTSDQRSRLGRAAQHQGSRNTNIAFAARRSNPGEGATMPLSFGLTFVDPRLTPVVLGHWE